jgi:hypothetical protein
LELVGSLAAYHPGAPLVILEGDADASFDVHMTTELFPRFAQMVNLIGARNKSGVRRLHRLLDELAAREQVPYRVFSITDKDSDAPESQSATALTWDVYHIENYLLDVESLAALMNDLDSASRVTAREIEAELEECALESVSKLVAHDVTTMLSGELRQSIEVRVDSGRAGEPLEWARALRVLRARVTSGVDRSLERFESDAFLAEISRKYSDSIAKGDWKRVIRGRDILQRLCGRGYSRGTPYPVFRNLIVSKMRDRGVKPTGMEHVLKQIVDF